MKTILIRPPRDKDALNLSHFTQSEPLGLEILYNIFIPYSEVIIFDMVFDKRKLDSIIDNSVVLVGISSICNDRKSTINLSKKIKKINSNINIFVGGYQATSTPQDFYTPSIDHIIKWTRKDNMEKLIKNIGEGKDEVIEGILSRKFDYLYRSSIEENEVLVSNRSSTEKYRKFYSYFAYRKIAILDSNMYFNEIDEIKEDKIAFVDYDFLESKNFYKIIEDIKNRKKRIMIYSSIESLIKKSDMLTIIGQVGVESVLVFINNYKDIDYLYIKEVLKGTNINLWIYLTVHPHYEKKDFIDIGKFAKGVEAKVMTITPYFPLKGTNEYEKYKDLFLYKNINEHYGKVVIQPKKVSIPLYYYYIVTCLFKFYSNKVFYFLKTFGLKSTMDFYHKSFLFAIKTFKILKNIKKD